MMDDLKYLMIVEPAEDEEGTYYGATFPDLPGCGTMARTLDDLRRSACEAVSVHVQALRDTGQPVPQPAAIGEEIVIKAS